MITVNIFQDAGLFREYLAERYGRVLELGGEAGTYFRAYRLARRLARLTGQTRAAIIETAIKDARELELEE